MQPGSTQRIEYYRQRADAAKPLFDEAPIGIPLLPRSEMYLRPPTDNPTPFDEKNEIWKAADVALEKSIVTALRRSRRPMSCKELVVRFGSSNAKLGWIVKSSQMLDKQNKLVVLVN